MKRIPLLLLMASACLCAQTTSIPVTLQIQQSALTTLLAAGPAGPQGKQGIQGVPGIVGPQGPQGLPGSAAVCPASTAVIGASRMFEAAPQPGDSLTKVSTPFTSSVPINAGYFTQAGQSIHVLATIDSTSISGTPQVGFVLNSSTPLSTPNGTYIGTASKIEYQEDFWITATEIGANGTITVYGKQTVQTGAVSANQSSAGTTLLPLTSFPINTTIANTLGFTTGGYSFTGTLQQTSLMAFFWP